MDRIVEYDVARIVRLIGTPQDHLIMSDCERPPRVGDTGAVVDIVGPDGRVGGSPDAPNVRYLVEDVAPDGRTVWLAEFRRDELAIVRPELKAGLAWPG